MSPAITERKALRFVVPDRAAFQALLALLPVADGSAPQQSVELYPDTPDLHLLRHGYTLCIESRSAEIQLTMRYQDERLCDQVSAAVQVNRDGGSDNAEASLLLKHILKPHRWPTHLAAIRDALPHQAKLLPHVQLQRTRYQWQAGQTGAADPAPVTEHLPPAIKAIALDSIAVYQGGSDKLLPFDAATTPIAHLYEVTLFPAHGKATPAKAALARFESFAHLEEFEGSSAVRALAALSLHPPHETTDQAGIQPLMTVAEACRLLLHTQLVEMLRNEAGVRFSDQIEYVHAMRVAIRRARAVLKLYSHFFHAKATRPYRKLLRDTAQFLGTVRDLDVALDNARQKNKERKKERAKLLAEWQAEREEAHRRLLKWLDSDKYAATIADYYHFCTTPGVGAKELTFAAGETPQPQQVRHVVPSLLMKRFEQVRTYEALFETAQAVDYATIHTLRIECKYLRYGLEFVRHLLEPEGETLIERLKTLQDLLGDLNDAVVASKMLTAADDTDADYLARQQAVVADLSSAVPNALGDFVNLENRQRFGRALANI